MKKVLITGGAGFIGFHLANYLAEKGYEVTIIDNLFRLKGSIDSELTEFIKKKNVRFIQEDLTESHVFEKLDKDYDHVYHLAAINGTEYFYKIPHKVLRDDVLATVNILDWFITTKCKKIIFASSSEAYAGTIRQFGLKVPTPEDIPLSIEDIFNPRWSYGGSKIIGELFFANYAKNYDFPMSIIRYHNIYGPRMGYEHVIPAFLQRIYQKTDPFPVYGNDTRDFCYIEDAVKMTELIMESEKCNGEVLNLGNGKNEISIVDLAKLMFEVLDFKAKIDIQTSPKGSVSRRCPDMTKTNQLINYRTLTDLRQGIKLTHSYYCSR